MSLPVLDMARLDRDEAGFRADLLAATHEVGFFHLVGHGIPEDVTAHAFAQAERFFALPAEDKGRVDWREQIDVGPERPRWDDTTSPAYMRLEGPNLWPDALPCLRAMLDDWQRRCSAIAMRLMRAWAVALGSPADVFEPTFGERPSTLVKLIRYPGRAERGQGVGAHKDPGMLTLLMIEPGKPGLQVGDDDVVDVPAVPGAFVVNIGELMEFATDGYLRATVHRVVSPPAGETRLSIPFFFNPALDSTVPRIGLPPELARRARGVSRDPGNVISGTFGDNMLKARLRAHPDVAATHHSDLCDRCYSTRVK